MEKNFWLSKWQQNDIGFHRPDIHPALLNYANILNPRSGQKVLVPLCGKSLDMLWWKNQGLQVIGVELSSVAIEAFFKENNLDFSKTSIEDYEVYISEDITIYQGDFFSFKGDDFDFIYDRAAVIALPEDLRLIYFQTLKKCIKTNTRYLAVTLEYDQSKLPGPPFSVPESEMRSQLLGFKIEKLSEKKLDIDNPKFNQAEVDPVEKVYLIQVENKKSPA